MKSTYLKYGLVCWCVALAAGCSSGHRNTTTSPPSTANAAPTVSVVMSQSAEEGSVVGPVVFTVGDAETSADALKVEVTSANADIVPEGSVDLGGSGVNRNLTIYLPEDKTGMTLVNVAVTDGAGAKTTGTFQLTVNARPTAQASEWLRQVAVVREESEIPIGLPVEDEQPVPADEDLNRLKIVDDTASNPTSYDDLLPADDAT